MEDAGNFLSTSESNEVSLLRNFPFFVNMSKNMSVVDWLVSPVGGACGMSKCTCGSSDVSRKNITNYQFVYNMHLFKIHVNFQFDKFNVRLKTVIEIK